MTIVAITASASRWLREIFQVVADSYPSGNRAATRQWWCGWGAVLMSTALAMFWAFWGAAETFHEGWYYPTLWQNIGLTLVQYASPAVASIAVGLLALWRPAAGGLVHLAAAIGAFWFFRHTPVGMNLIAWPLIALATAYAYGRPEPRSLARRLVVIVPVLTALVSGAYPAWRVLTRPDNVDLSMRRIEGNGVSLVWAPAGPGWDTSGFDWFEAKRRCEYLASDGAALAATAQRIWRLPTVDEAVRTMVYRGRNAGGVWDPQRRRAAYRVIQPDKEAPLWNPHSRVIYWWTADEVGPDRAHRVSYKGGVHLSAKNRKAGYLAARCVRSD